MKMHILALCLPLIATPALAQKYSRSADEASAGRAAMLQSLQRGKEITANGERYLHLPEVRAVEGKAAAAGEVIETKGKLVLYRGAATDAATIKRAGGSLEYPTVVNARTGALGVLTGVLVVKPKNMSDAEAIASSNGLQLSKAFPHLQTVFYKAKPGEDIADLSAALQADPRVESAYPEIIERVRKPL
jgi:hypothetical protein